MHMHACTHACACARACACSCRAATVSAYHSLRLRTVHAQVQRHGAEHRLRLPMSAEVEGRSINLACTVSCLAPLHSLLITSTYWGGGSFSLACSLSCGACEALRSMHASRRAAACTRPCVRSRRAPMAGPGWLDSSCRTIATRFRCNAGRVDPRTEPVL